MGVPVTLVDAGGAPVTLVDAAGQSVAFGTMAAQDADDVDITGGTIAGITDLAVADGGTGASSASAARSNLGLVIGTDVSAPVRPIYVAGRWYGFNPGLEYQAGQALPNHYLSVLPFMLHRAITLSDLAVVVTTAAGAGELARAGIYASNPTTLMPTGLPVAATGDLAVDATGTISGDIIGANVTLQPGLYWQAIVQNNGNGIYRSIGTSVPWSQTLIGATDPADAIGTGEEARLFWRANITYGALPDVTAVTFDPVRGTRECGLVYGKAA